MEWINNSSNSPTKAETDAFCLYRMCETNKIACPSYWCIYYKSYI